MQSCGEESGPIVDMHFHLGFCEDPAGHAASARASGIAMLAVSCEPGDYARVLPLASPGLVPALGLHPWWIADGRAGMAETAAFELLAPEAEAFGELGLDFDDRHAPADSHADQLAAFERCCVAADASARAAGVRKPLSLHAFRATGTVLDVLERAGCLESCACIFHWFAGSQPELSLAIEAGCWFSVNERAARSKRWKEYAKLVPPGKLLLETDLPVSSGSRLSTREQRVSLESAARVLESSAGQDVLERTSANASALIRGNRLP